MQKIYKVKQPVRVKMTVYDDSKEKYATSYLGMLMYEGPQHCPGPKLTRVVSLNSL